VSEEEVIYCSVYFKLISDKPFTYPLVKAVVIVVYCSLLPPPKKNNLVILCLCSVYSITNELIALLLETEIGFQTHTL